MPQQEYPSGNNITAPIFSHQSYPEYGPNTATSLDAPYSDTMNADIGISPSSQAKLVTSQAGAVEPEAPLEENEKQRFLDNFEEWLSRLRPDDPCLYDNLGNQQDVWE